MAFTTIPLSNQKLLAGTFTSLITEVRPVTVQKTGNGTAFPSTTALANEPGMAAAVVAGVTYCFDAVVVYEAGGVADIKMAWTFPTASFHYTAWTINTAGGIVPIASPSEASDTAKQFGGLGIGTPAVVTYTGFIIVSSSGTLQFRRAQVTSTAENTRINAGSWLRLVQAV